jgi:hypothetical protein
MTAVRKRSGFYSLLLSPVGWRITPLNQGVNLFPADSFVAYAGHGLQEASIEEPVDGRLRNPKGGGGFGDGIGEGFGRVGPVGRGRGFLGEAKTGIEEVPLRFVLRYG